MGQKLALGGLAALLVACGVSGPDHQNVYQGDATVPESGAGASPTSGSVSHASASSSQSVAATSGSGGEPATSSSASGGGDEICTPAMDDGPCVACLEQECCDEIEACMQDPSCQCWASCIESQDWLACEPCGLPNSWFYSLLTCAEGCQLECGF